MVVTDDRKPLLQDDEETTGTRRRSFSSDRERHKRESRSDAGEAGYGGEKFLSLEKAAN